MPRYKVIEQKTQRMFRGRMSAAQLEQLLNTNTRDGWVLDRIVAADTPRFLGIGRKRVLLVVFRQDDR